MINHEKNKNGRPDVTSMHLKRLNQIYHFPSVNLKQGKGVGFGERKPCFRLTSPLTHFRTLNNLFNYSGLS